MSLSIIILAAGRGTRMKSELPKTLHKVTGREMLNMVIDEAKTLNPQNISIVVSEDMKQYEAKICAAHPTTSISFILQKERKGTAHAVEVAANNIADLGDKTLVLYGDTPLIERQTLAKMSAKLDDFALCVLAFDDEEANAYGRLVIDGNGHVEKIVEFKDASDEERKISLCNSGVIAVDGKKIREMLSRVENNNAAKEFYLTDLVGIAGEMGLKRTFLKTAMSEVLGVNSKIELARVEKIKQRQIRLKMMSSGVTLIDPKSVHFAFDTQISNDSIIHPNVVFGPGVEVASNVEIKSFSHIEGAKISSGSIVGPFARLRPGSELAENVKIGNFVEVKKSQIKTGAKINHLSYIGDSEIGENSNIGAGTITCNYDGYNKAKTTIGKNVFIGSNSALVAPVKIGDGSLIAAGSVITKDIEENDLAVARGKQTNITNGGKKFHEKNSKKTD
jgi:bifunctional UDP-N-acetylglucosamine pyrophosphorylase/glucosamine-1-phosphate N-acetyltransferase